MWCVWGGLTEVKNIHKFKMTCVWPHLSESIPHQMAHRPLVMSSLSPPASGERNCFLHTKNICIYTSSTFFLFVFVLLIPAFLGFAQSLCFQVTKGMGEKGSQSLCSDSFSKVSAHMVTYPGNPGILRLTLKPGKILEL